MKENISDNKIVNVVLTLFLLVLFLIEPILFLNNITDGTSEVTINYNKILIVVATMIFFFTNRFNFISEKC